MSSEPRTYGLFHKTAEDKSRCIEKIHGGERWPSFHQCNRKRGYGPNKEFCKIHDPMVVKARVDARMKKYEDQFARQMAPYDRIKELESVISQKDEALEKITKLIGHEGTQDAWKIAAFALTINKPPKL